MTAGALAAPLAAEGQQVRTNRVGVLTIGDPAQLRQELRNLGHIEGRNLVLEVRQTEGTPNRVEDSAFDLARLNVDVIVATYPGAVFSARRASATIPIVMVNTPDPVELGLAASLARPGGNITGVTSLSTDMSTKQLEFLKEAVPRVSRVAVMWNPDNPWHPLAVKALQGQEQRLGVQLHVVGVRGPNEFDEAFNIVVANRAQALVMFADPMMFVHRKRLAEVAAKHRLPAMGGLKAFAEAGALMSYWADQGELFRRAATYVDRIPKAPSPAISPSSSPPSSNSSSTSAPPRPSVSRSLRRCCCGRIR